MSPQSIIKEEFGVSLPIKGIPIPYSQKSGIIAHMDEYLTSDLIPATAFDFQIRMSPQFWSLTSYKGNTYSILTEIRYHRPYG
ncbi:hypothetical protein K1719_026907 [Acacia pycnantha]|nr:hypothetical protein K1719_026907 [Acacia pycnantha]